MSDQPENLILVYLRRIDEKLDRARDDLQDVTRRLTAVELGLASVRREVAVLAEGDAHLGARIDKVTERLDRIDRRLDIVPAL